MCGDVLCRMLLYCIQASTFQGLCHMTASFLSVHVCHGCCCRWLTRCRSCSRWRDAPRGRYLHFGNVGHEAIYKVVCRDVSVLQAGDDHLLEGGHAVAERRFHDLCQPIGGLRKVAMVSAPQRLCVNNWCLMLSLHTTGNRSGQHSHTDIDTQKHVGPHAIMLHTLTTASVSMCSSTSCHVVSSSAEKPGATVAARLRDIAGALRLLLLSFGLEGSL